MERRKPEEHLRHTEDGKVVPVNKGVHYEEKTVTVTAERRKAMQLSLEGLDGIDADFQAEKEKVKVRTKPRSATTKPKTGGKSRGRRQWRPFKPSPPPLWGKAQELADQCGGDYQKFMDLLDEEGFVVFDYETTGLDDGNVPVQIGAVRIKGGKTVARFNVFVNPERPLSDWSKENLKNADGAPLTDAWLESQTSLRDSHEQLVDFLGDGIIVAHNFPFDGEILERITREHGIEYHPTGTIDTLSLLRQAVRRGGNGASGPENHKLPTLATYFGVDLGDRAHTADADSEAAAEVLRRGMAWAAEKNVRSKVFDGAFQQRNYEAAWQRYEEELAEYEGRR
jgi:DNA polymerase III epsilon subunit-like protein